MMVWWKNVNSGILDLNVNKRNKWTWWSFVFAKPNPEIKWWTWNSFKEKGQTVNRTHRFRTGIRNLKWRITFNNYRKKAVAIVKSVKTLGKREKLEIGSKGMEEKGRENGERKKRGRSLMRTITYWEWLSIRDSIFAFIFSILIYSISINIVSK